MTNKEFREIKLYLHSRFCNPKFKYITTDLKELSDHELKQYISELPESILSEMRLGVRNRKIFSGRKSSLPSRNVEVYKGGTIMVQQPRATDMPDTILAAKLLNEGVSDSNSDEVNKLLSDYKRELESISGCRGCVKRAIVARYTAALSRLL